MKTIFSMFIAAISSGLTCSVMAVIIFIINNALCSTETQSLSIADLFVTAALFGGLGLIFAMLLIPFLESITAPLLVFVFVGALVPSILYFASTFLPSVGATDISFEYRHVFFLILTGAFAATVAWIVLRKTIHFNEKNV